LPFRIFIADGEVHPTIARLIEDHSVFPNLQIEYHRYTDRTFYDFHQKLNDAFSKITSPYVMLSDNDDFLFPSGIIRSLNFLEYSTDYVCAGWAVGHFETKNTKTVYRNLFGSISRIWYQQSKAYQSYNLESALASERVFTVHVGSLTVHYNVYRLDALRCIARELLEHDFSRIENSELFWRLRTATLGKLKSDGGGFSYFRQVGTSLNPSRKNDFIDTLSAGAYLAEIQRVVKAIASICARNDGVSGDVLKKKLGECSAEDLRAKLILVLGWRATVKSRFKKYLPEVFFRRLRLAGDWIRSGKSSATGGRPIPREQMFKLIGGAGASEELVGEQRKEFAEIEVTLEGREFFAFIQRQAPELLLQNQDNLAGSLGR
jgi:glycosyltransferase domain-containing protein